MATEDVTLRMRLQGRTETASGVASVKTTVTEAGAAARAAGAEAAEGARGWQLVTRSMEETAAGAAAVPGKLLASGREAGEKWGEGFRETARSMLLGIGGFFAAEHLFEFGKESITEAAQTQANIVRAQVLYGKEGAEQIESFAKRAADAYGLSESTAIKQANSFALLGSAAGLHGEELAKFGTTFEKMSSDMAAYAGTTQDQALSALQSGLRGRGTALKQYGIVMSTSALQAEALHDHIIAPTKDAAQIAMTQSMLIADQKAYSDAVAKSGATSLEALKAHVTLEGAQVALNKAVAGSVPPLTDQQKALAAQQLIMRQAGDTQGAFASHSDLLAEKQQKLGAEMDNVKDKIGTALLPIENDLVDFMLHKGVPALKEFSDWFEHKGVKGVEDFAGKLKPLATSVLPAAKTALSDVKDIVGPLATDVGKLADGFNAMPDWLQKTVVGAGVGLYGASKLRGLAGTLSEVTGVGGTGRAGLGGTGVVDVFVTNPGFGTGGPGGTPGAAEAGAEAGTVASEAETGLTAAQRAARWFRGGGPMTGALAGDVTEALPFLSSGLLSKLTMLPIYPDHQDGPPIATLANYPKPVQEYGALTRFLGVDQSDPKNPVGSSQDVQTAIARFTSTATLAQFKGLEATLTAQFGQGKGFGFLDQQGARMGANWGISTALPPSFTDRYHTLSMEADAASAKKLGDTLAALPKEVRTQITTPGADTSRTALMRLSDQADLTAKQRKLLVQLANSADLLAQLHTINATADNTARPRTLSITEVGHLLTGGFFGSAPSGSSPSPTPTHKRARGGPLGAGDIALVGEDGPEVWVPDRAGTIIPNVATRGGASAVAMADQDIVLHSTLNLDGKVAAQSTDRHHARTLARL
jgi:hypothetical protein